jgi:hypothetical protein
VLPDVDFQAVCILSNGNNNTGVDKIEKNEIGGLCSTYGREERRIQGFGWGNMRETQA